MDKTNYIRVFAAHSYITNKDENLLFKIPLFALTIISVIISLALLVLTILLIMYL